jgi:hypothetical protein
MSAAAEAEEPAVGAQKPAFGGGRSLLARTPVRAGLISVFVLIPCFWQKHIEAVDLPSHLYNAWLAILVGEGRAPGLKIVFQSSNVLFDVMLSGLMRAMGPRGAEHIAVPLSVLVFVWGAFAAVCAMTRRRPWHMLAIIAMLAYGWVFHMGFMNFYLGTGLSLWAFALLWKPSGRSALCALPLIALAWSAHPLPVAWLSGVLVYTLVARAIPPRARPILTFAVLAALAILRTFLLTHFATRWTVEQGISMTGVDQVGVFESKYLPLEFGLLAVWLSLFVRVLRRKGPARLLFGIPFQLCLIVAAAVFLLPGAILLPGYDHALRYVGERMSLLVAVSVCALIGGVAPGKPEKAAIGVMIALFFSSLYIDERSLNYVESLLEQSVAAVPYGTRVVSALCEQRGDINLLNHTLDRACIGRCFAYANYEPPSKAFRVRVEGESPLVVTTDAESGALQVGTYVVKPRDLPLFQIYLRGRNVDSRWLKAGDATGSTCFESGVRPRSLVLAPAVEAR